jgi:hypothetical protein
MRHRKGAGHCMTHANGRFKILLGGQLWETANVIDLD